MKKKKTAKKTVKKTAKPNMIIIAEGEATGHAHRIKGVWIDKVAKKFAVESKTPLVHEEHNAVTLTPGVYQDFGVKEYNAFEEEATREREVKD